MPIHRGAVNLGVRETLQAQPLKLQQEACFSHFDMVVSTAYAKNNRERDLMEFSCEWNDMYATGVDHIDNQHKTIFNIANSIASKNTREEISACVLTLYKYTREHFSDEEFLMEQINYPETKSHQELHNTLITELNDLSEKKFNEDTSLLDFKIFVIKWVVDHIMTHDKKFIAFMQEQKLMQKDQA